MGLTLIARAPFPVLCLAESAEHNVDRDFRAEVEEQLDGIARNREIWKRRLPDLRREGASPSEELVREVEDHLKGLDESEKRLREILRKYKARKNANWT
jgi:hypothetical protein